MSETDNGWHTERSVWLVLFYFSGFTGLCISRVWHGSPWVSGMRYLDETLAVDTFLKHFNYILALPSSDSWGVQPNHAYTMSDSSLSDSCLCASVRVHCSQQLLLLSCLLTWWWCVHWFIHGPLLIVSYNVTSFRCNYWVPLSPVLSKQILWASLNSFSFSTVCQICPQPEGLNCPFTFHGLAKNTLLFSASCWLHSSEVVNATTTVPHNQCYMIWVVHNIIVPSWNP